MYSAAVCGISIASPPAGLLQRRRASRPPHCSASAQGHQRVFGWLSAAAPPAASVARSPVTATSSQGEPRGSQPWLPAAHALAVMGALAQPHVGAAAWVVAAMLVQAGLVCAAAQQMTARSVQQSVARGCRPPAPAPASPLARAMAAHRSEGQRQSGQAVRLFCCLVQAVTANAVLDALRMCLSSAQAAPLRVISAVGVIGEIGTCLMLPMCFLLVRASARALDARFQFCAAAGSRRRARAAQPGRRAAS